MFALTLSGLATMVRASAGSTWVPSAATGGRMNGPLPSAQCARPSDPPVLLAGAWTLTPIPVYHREGLAVLYPTVKGSTVMPAEVEAVPGVRVTWPFTPSRAGVTTVGRVPVSCHTRLQTPIALGQPR